MLARYEKKHLFITVFLALNLVFAFYQFSYFWGNHDWDWVKGTTQVLSLNTGLFEGRYGKFILNVTLFAGQVLPLLNTIIALALLAVGTTFLTTYWQIERPSAKFFIALLPVLSPFILGWLYFPINILGNFAAVPLVVVGLICTEKEGSRFKIISIICFLLALGVYPSVLEMTIICFCFRHILNPNKKAIYQSAIFIFLSLILFKVILYFLTQAGVIYGSYYNVQSANPADMLQRLPETCKIAINQLWHTVPFMPQSYKMCTLLMVILSLLISMRHKQTLLLWCVAFLATVASVALSTVPDEVAFMPRINFYGLNFFYAGTAAVLLQQNKLWRNLGYAFSALCLFLSVNQNLYAQKVWNLGKNAEEQLVERISSRIEQKSKHYPLIPVFAGELPLRPRYYSEISHHKSPYVLNASFLIRHIPSGMFNFYAPQDYFTKQAQISGISPEMFSFLQNASRPWPAEEGVYIDNSYAIILITTEGISAIKSQLPQ